MTGGAKLLLTGLVLLSAAGHLGGPYRVLELASHFRVQYLLLTGLLLLLFAARRQARWSALALVAAALNLHGLLSPMVPAAVAVTDSGRDAVAVRRLLANLQYSNNAHEAFITLATDEQPDIIVVEEVTRDWAEALAGLGQRYPARLLVPRDSPFGIGILSRWPMPDVEQLDFGHRRYPALLARITTPGGPLSLLAAHPPPPVDDGLFMVRNHQLREAAALLQQLGPRTVLLGDLNTSPWSPLFSELLQTSGMNNARDGFGLLPTWPSYFPPAMIPIDHCLVSPDTRVRAIKTGPRIGSDHLPLIIDLLVQKTDNTRARVSA